MPWARPGETCHSVRKPAVAERLDRGVERHHRDQRVGLAMDEEDGGLVDVPVLEMLRPGEQAGIADDAGDRRGPAEADVKRHHRPLAEADEGEVAVGELEAGELGVEEGLQCWRGMRDAAPVGVEVAEGERKPLPAHRRLVARVGGVGGGEGGVGEDGGEHPAEVDEVVAVGAVAVEKYHQLLRRPAVRGRQSRSVDHCHPRRIKAAPRPCCGGRDSRTRRAARRPPRHGDHFSAIA